MKPFAWKLWQGKLVLEEHPPLKREEPFDSAPCHGSVV